MRGKEYFSPFPQPFLALVSPSLWPHIYTKQAKNYPSAAASPSVIPRARGAGPCLRRPTVGPNRSPAASPAGIINTPQSYVGAQAADDPAVRSAYDPRGRAPCSAYSPPVRPTG